MDYAKHYAALISRARGRELDGPSESHHVIPRCMGGSDGAANRVDLTPAEHYVAHLMMVRIFPDIPGLILAAVLMSRDNRNGKRSNNKLYAWLRKRASDAQIKRQTGVPLSRATRLKISAILKASPAMARAADDRRGVPRKESHRKKMSDSARLSEPAIAARAALTAKKIGVPRSAETKAKLSAAHSGKTLSDSHRSNISEALKGRKQSPEHTAKVSAALTGRPGYMKGRKHSEETKEKMRVAGTGRKMSPESIAKMISSKTREQRRAGALKAWETKRAKAALKQN